MDKSKHTPGPWNCAALPNIPLLSIYIYVDAEDGKEPKALPVTEGNARLIAAAPAMDLALSMIACGIARIERSGRLEEFCFDGMRYCLNGDWNALFRAIGWDKARAAIARATGATP